LLTGIRRAIPQEPDATPADKSTKSATRPDVQQSGFDTPPHPYNTVSQTATAIPEFSALEEPTNAPQELCWEQGVDESVRSDQVRYVQHQSPGGPRKSSVPRHSNAPWHDYSIAMETHRIIPEYRLYDGFKIPDSFMPLSPMGNASPMDISYQYTYPGYSQDSWTSTRTHQPEDQRPS
jgi:hypothetical protein